MFKKTKKYLTAFKGINLVLFQSPFGLDFSIRSSCFNRGEGCVNKKLDHQNHICTYYCIQDKKKEQKEKKYLGKETEYV